MNTRRLHPALAVVLAASLAACQPADQAQDGEAASDAASDANVVNVTARDFAFEAPAEIPSGWTTFRMENAGQQEHFLVLWRLPEGRTFQEYQRDVAGPFDEKYSRFLAGEVDQAGLMEALGQQIPEWFFTSVQGRGGPGLTAPGGTSQATVRLEPGTYVMECYVKTAEGEFHGALGMLRPLTVTEEATGATPPEADLTLTLSNYEIAVQGEATPGRHTVRVDYAENPEGLLTHDVHLARLQGDTALDDVVAWMDWVPPEGMTAPAPAEFLGGAEQMPAGHTAYFTVELEPGRYAWISELAGQGMVREFTVE